KHKARFGEYPPPPEDDPDEDDPGPGGPDGGPTDRQPGGPGPVTLAPSEPASRPGFGDRGPGPDRPAQDTPSPSPTASSEPANSGASAPGPGDAGAPAHPTPASPRATDEPSRASEILADQLGASHPPTRVGEESAASDERIEEEDRAAEVPAPAPPPPARITAQPEITDRRPENRRGDCQTLTKTDTRPRTAAGLPSAWPGHSSRPHRSGTSHARGNRPGDCQTLPDPANATRCRRLVIRLRRGRPEPGGGRAADHHRPGPEPVPAQQPG
ncbi:MAG: hypothetical protein JWO38_7973, partial [Gemmataceae bacterium]|nr:hypothetical protein [Gemmataceae bacterium]